VGNHQAQEGRGGRQARQALRQADPAGGGGRPLEHFLSYRLCFSSPCTSKPQGCS